MITDMTTGNPLRHILLFSIPLLIGNIFQQLYNITDLVIVGRFLGVEAFASIGAVAPLFFLLTFIIVGMTNGFAIITGQKYGAKDIDGMKYSVITSIVLTVIITILFSIFCTLFINPILHWMNLPKEIYHNAFWYTEIIVSGLIVTAMYNIISGVIRALGDSKTPLYFLVIASVINIFLAVIFIRFLGWGVPGSAVAVIISQAISVILCILFIRYKLPILHISFRNFKFDYKFIESAKNHLKLGIPMALQFSIIGLGILIIQSVCNTFGANVIASLTASLRIEQLATMPMVSFGVALATYVAQNYGAKKIKRIKLGVIKTSTINIILSVVMAMIMRYWGTDIIRAFIGTATPEIIDIAHKYLLISTAFYFFLGQIFIFRNALQGMGNASFPLFASIAELLMRSFAAVYLAMQFGYIGIFYSGPIAWISASIIVFFGYQKSIKYFTLKNFVR